MKRTLALFALIAPFLLAADRLTIEKSMQVRELQDPQFSPDGKRIAFIMQEPVKDRAMLRHIWLYDVSTHETRQWTTSAKSESSPRWSPDGQTLAFLSDREDSQQIWLMPAAGGEAVKLTSAKNSIQNFRWSRDGKRIAFLASDPRTAAEEKKQREGDDERMIDQDRKPTRAWIVELASKAVKAYSNAPWSVREFDWMPDGKSLIVVATDRPAVEQRTERIYSLSLEDGRMTELLNPKGPFRGVQVSPGGDEIAYVSSPGDGPGAHDLFICPLASRVPRNVTGPALDRPVTAFQWMNDKEIAALIANGFHSELDVFGSAKPRKLISDDTMDVAHFTLSRNGAVAYSAESATILPELWADGKPVTHFNDSFSNVALAKPELYHYESFDGLPIEAALYRSAGTDAGRPQPVVILIHGGPAGSWRNHFDALTQLLVAQGYTVMQPNIRGSVGYGQKFLASNRGDWGGNDFKDVMAGVDDLVKRNIADPNRMGIAGWSYGGYMAEWAITQTDRFKFAICGAGMADLATEFGTESRPDGDEWYYGTPYENLAGFRKSSPIVYIKNAKTPTLILQGEADTTDPISESQMLYRGLKRYNVPSEFVVYPREPHGLREQKHIADRYRRSLEWADKYIGH